MTDDPYGGPAFPCAENVLPADSGMTLRDWFAGQALVGLLQGIRAHPDTGIPSPETFAWDAYQLADFMLEARK